MKICYAADAASIHTQKWVDYFVSQGHQVDIITFLWGDLPGARVHHFKAPFGFKLFGKKPFTRKLGYLALIPGIRRLVHQLKPDILHAHSATSYGLMGALAGYHPFILSTWGHDIQWEPKRTKAYEIMVRHNLSKADVITATSVNLTQDTKAYAPPATPIFTVPFGVDCDLFRPLTREHSVRRPLTIGVIKRLEEECGIQDLIAAFALLRPRLPETRLMIVGEGSCREALEALVRSLGVTDSVAFVGWVENAKLPEMVNQFDVFSLPSHRESFGVAVLEALACGVPVVATNVGGLPEVMRDGETGYLVPPCSPQVLLVPSTVIKVSVLRS